MENVKTKQFTPKKSAPGSATTTTTTVSVRPVKGGRRGRGMPTNERDLLGRLVAALSRQGLFGGPSGAAPVPQKRKSGAPKNSNVPRRVRNNYSEGAQGAIQTLMKRLMFPDSMPPPVLGFRHNTLTVPHRLFWEFSAPWGTAISPVPGALPVNELFCVTLNRHPNCCLIYNEWTNNSEVLTPVITPGSRPQIHPEEFLTFNIVTGATPANGTSWQPAFDPPEGVSEGTYMWLDGDSNTTVTVAISAPTNAFLATTTYALSYVRRVGSTVIPGSTSFTVGGAPVNNIIFTLPGSSPGYYCFLPSTNFPEFAPTAINIAITRAASTWAIRHSPLPADLSGNMEAIRINANRATMTNFSGPFNAEGGAVACELPTFKRWDELAIPINVAPSLFSNVANLEGKRIIENYKGLSTFGHADIECDPYDPLESGGNFTAGGVYSKPGLDDIAGGSILVIRTALSNTAARDGYWQLHWATESETDSQLWARCAPEYSPAVIAEASQRLKTVTVITDNPDHFRQGIQALRGVSNTADKLGDAAFRTVIGAPLGGPLKTGAAALRAFTSIF